MLPHPDIARIRLAAGFMRRDHPRWHAVAAWLDTAANEAERHAAQGMGSCATEITQPFPIAAADGYLADSSPGIDATVTAPPELVPVIAKALRFLGMHAAYRPLGASNGEHTGLAATWPEPDACGTCGWTGNHRQAVGYHDRTEPTDAQRKARMQARRADRQEARAGR